MPSPSDFFTASEVRANRYIIEEKRANIFAPDANGDCRTDADVVVFANQHICIYWQKNANEIPYRQILLALNWLSKYMTYGGYIMNYDPTQEPISVHTGRDGITRKWVIEANTQLCPGYGGAAYNGQSWCAISQADIMILINTAASGAPTIPQVIFYEMGRAMYNLKLDRILDWQMEQSEQYGYWTLGFTGAMTAVMPDLIGCKMNYFGQDAAGFRADRLRDLSTYVNNASYTFQNTWSVLLLPWNKSQSINDVMSGLLIYLFQNYGGAVFLHQMYYFLCQQPESYSRAQREQRAGNLVRACYLAVRQMSGETKALQIHKYFYTTLRWRFVGSRPMIMPARL